MPGNTGPHPRTQGPGAPPNGHPPAPSHVPPRTGPPPAGYQGGPQHHVPFGPGTQRPPDFGPTGNGHPPAADGQQHRSPEPQHTPPPDAAQPPPGPDGRPPVAVQHVDPSAYGVPKVVHRDVEGWARDENALYRGDTRSPEEIRAAGGFHPHDSTKPDLLKHVDGDPNAFVSTSTEQQVAKERAGRGAIYVINAPGGILTDRTLDAAGHDRRYGESEVLFPGGVDWRYVAGWHEVRHEPGQGLVPGPFVPNPDYIGDKDPAPRPRADDTPAQTTETPQPSPTNRSEPTPQTPTSHQVGPTQPNQVPLGQQATGQPGPPHRPPTPYPQPHATQPNGGQAPGGQPRYSQPQAGQPHLGQPAAQAPHGQAPMGQTPPGQPHHGQPAAAQAHTSQPALGQQHHGQPPAQAQSGAPQTHANQTPPGQPHQAQPAAQAHTGQLAPGQPHHGQPAAAQAHTSQNAPAQTHTGQAAPSQPHHTQPATQNHTNQNPPAQTHTGQTAPGQAPRAGQPHSSSTPFDHTRPGQAGPDHTRHDSTGQQRPGQPRHGPTPFDQARPRHSNPDHTRADQPGPNQPFDRARSDQAHTRQDQQSHQTRPGQPPASPPWHQDQTPRQQQPYTPSFGPTPSAHPDRNQHPETGRPHPESTRPQSTHPEPTRPQSAHPEHAQRATPSTDQNHRDQNHRDSDHGQQSHREPDHDRARQRDADNESRPQRQEPPLSRRLRELDPDVDRRVRDHVASTPAGMSIFDRTADSNQQHTAKQLPKIPGQFVLDMHGSPDSAKIGKSNISAKDVAAVIKANPDWDGKTPITLVGCETGKRDNGFAAQLAKELGVEVTAPNTHAWVDYDGNLFASNTSGNERPGWPPNGEWRAFGPDGAQRVHESPYPPGHKPTWGDAGQAEAPESAARRGDDDERPEHIERSPKLKGWIYEDERPKFSAQTKHVVYSRTHMNADGSFVCSTSGVAIPVQKGPDGHPVFWETRESGRTYQTDPPAWYTRAVEDGIPPTPEDLAPPQDKFPKPEPGTAHMGHIDEAEYWRQVQFAIYHEMSAAEFKKIYDHPDHYRLEAKAANESHEHESNTRGYGYYDPLREMMTPGPTPDSPEVPKFPPTFNAPDPGDIYKGRPKPGRRVGGSQ